MSRAPVTIAILAWNSWDTTRACLDSLRPTLGPRDQVVVVDNGSTDGTAAGLRRYPWVEVVTNAENRGFAGGCNDGAARARHGIVIFLNNDTVLVNRWIDPLVEVFSDPLVGAAGPRSNFVAGPQVVGEAEYTSMSGMRRFARRWMEDHRGRVSQAAYLVGFCIGVRRSLFEELGGFDESYGIGGFEDDDLCQRMVAGGYRLAICHGSFVHHDGHKTFDANGLDWHEQQESNRERFLAAHQVERPAAGPLVSGCLIVKDEEDRLEECLQSLQGVADQVVVYDTGSSDGTVELARRMGATVIEGYWDDDFSRARNVALEQCEGEWIVWLDADETLQGNGRDLRSVLSRTRSNIDGWSVRIQNLTGVGAGSEFIHHATRIFRRSRCEWTGRLHEQIARREDHGAIVQAVLDDAYIRHTGYMDQAMGGRAKAERNLRVAQAEVDSDDGWDRGYSLTSLARSLLLAGRFEECLERVAEALECTDNGITRRLAVRAAIDASMALNRLDDAIDWCRRMGAEGAEPNSVTAMEATVRVARRDWKEALALLDRVRAGHADADGFAAPPGLVAAQKAKAYGGLGRHAEAAETLLASLSDEGVLDDHLGALVDHMRRSGRPLWRLAEAIPANRANVFLAQLLQMHSEPADSVLEACLSHQGSLDPKAILATASRLGERLPVERAMVWSARIREAGYPQGCPLIGMARSAAPPVLRARAAAVAKAAFGDARAEEAFRAAMALATPLEMRSIRDEVAQLCPDLAPLAGTPEPVAAPGPAGRAVPAGAVPVAAGTAEAPPRLRASLVIPCFNRADMTVQCLQSLAAHTEPGTYEVILVDNGSTDATAQIQETESAGFRVIRNEKNLGFARACNQGAAAARTDIVVFFNNDVVATDNWLPPLIAALDQEPDVGIVGCRLLFPDGSIQHAGVDLVIGVDGKLHGYHRYYQQGADHPAALVRCELPAVTGAVLAVRRNVFEELGQFCEHYWNGNEDVDLCLTAAERGWRVLYEPASTLVHFESQSGAERWSAYEPNVDLFQTRWYEKYRRGRLGRAVATAQSAN